MEGFLSTLPVRGATDGLAIDPERICISIHAPREGSDLHADIDKIARQISIHAPREGSDLECRQEGLDRQP